MIVRSNTSSTNQTFYYFPR